MSRRNFPTLRRLSAAASFLLLVSCPIMAQEGKSVVLELDHVSVCGSSLETLRQAFADVGLVPDFGGPHSNGVTHMAAVGFDDGTYIELIAPVKAGVTTGSEWAKFMGEDAATCAWAVGTNVLVQEVDRLKKAGIAVTTQRPAAENGPTACQSSGREPMSAPGPRDRSCPSSLKIRHRGPGECRFRLAFRVLRSQA